MLFIWHNRPLYIDFNLVQMIVGCIWFFLLLLLFIISAVAIAAAAAAATSTTRHCTVHYNDTEGNVK